MPSHTINLPAPFAVNPRAVHSLDTGTPLPSLEAVGKGSVQAFAVEASHSCHVLNRASHALGEL